MISRIGAPSRVLVVTKFRYLGDTIVATPFLRRLHEAFPEARVTLLAGPLIPTLLKGCPYVETIWPFDTDAPDRVKRNRELIARIRAARFDAAFLLNRSLHSAFVTAMAGVPHRVGFATEYRGPMLTVRVAYDRTTREIDCYLDLLRAVGVDASYAMPELWVTPEERCRARDILCEALGMPPKPPLVLIQPGSKDPARKQWETARFAQVADRLVERACATIALIGASEEQGVCAEMARLSQTPVVNLSGKTNLREALGLLAEADALIANDSAMIHAAAGLGTATVVIHGPQTARKWGYGGPRHCVVTVSEIGGPADRQANRQALDRIQAEPVVDAALSVLDERSE